ncbi:MAG: CheR family methyltransferase [Spirochaetia bacterium]
MSNRAVRPMSARQFKIIAAFVEKTSGIQMPRQKMALMESRLNSRLVSLGFDNYDAYIKFAFSSSRGRQDELVHMMDAMTTNKTFFFREMQHFDALANQILPEILKKKRVIRIWSAGCSTGEEAYSIAITVEEYMRRNNIHFSYEILGTDVSTRVLSVAVDAIYPMQDVENFSIKLKRNYLLRGRDADGNEIVRIKPEIRKRVKFKYLNFMSKRYDIEKNFDIIFFRNVIIYYSKQTRQEVLSRLCQHLQRDMYLFLSQSESIVGIDLPLEGQAASSVYRRI